MAIVNIVRYEKSGWEVLGRLLNEAKLSVKKKKKQDMNQEVQFSGIKLILDMIDWNKLKKHQS